MAKKDISKSIRLTQEVYDYIDEAAGNGFNEKFENIILEAKAQESERKKRLAELEKYIRKKQDELNDLFDEYRYLDEFFRSFIRMQHQLNNLEEDLHKAMEKNENLKKEN